MSHILPPRKIIVLMLLYYTLFILAQGVLTSVFCILAISELSRYSGCLPLFTQYAAAMPAASPQTQRLGNTLISPHAKDETPAA